jgi:23S rRNA (cytidine1920-2'-O)/16S rRNA (cytidine1409-2'-O)-methyltransferase
MVADDARVTVKDDAPLRGTLKLRAALARFGVRAFGKTAVDFGASTGSFTVALLEAGATRVYAVDAGNGQLLGILRVDPRVVNTERTNLGEVVLPEPVGLITIDLAVPLARARRAADCRARSDDAGRRGHRSGEADVRARPRKRTDG